MIDPSGTVINHRRKIRATHVEGLVFCGGTGDTLKSVVETEIGRIDHLSMDDHNSSACETSTD